MAKQRTWLQVVSRVFIVLVIVIGGGLFVLRGRGVDARSEPYSIEKEGALFLRGWMTPTRYKTLLNPVTASADVLTEGREHFADHCATCHGNNGSGDTEIGRSLYPRAPDMRLARTQGLTDGEIFYIIENGVRLTGMPAWSTGTPEGETASWKLVHFIRHIPSLTPEEVAEMETMNPKTPAEMEEQKSIDDFLKGDAPATESKAPPHKHPQ